YGAGRCSRSHQGSRRTDRAGPQPGTGRGRSHLAVRCGRVPHLQGLRVMTPPCWQLGCEDPATVADVSMWAGPTTERVTVHGFCDDHAWRNQSPTAPDVFVYRNEAARTV